MNRRRAAVGALGGASAGIAGLVGAVSLTRIAGDYLGFPEGLEWTLTGAVDVAGIAGGIMWTAFRGRVRRIGQPMNVVCTLVSGVGVGLDHATNAGKALGPGVDHGPWPAAAFAVGLFIPLLFTWLVHALAIIGDQAAPAGHREPGRLARWWTALRAWRPPRLRRPAWTRRRTPEPEDDTAVESPPEFEPADPDGDQPDDQPDDDRPDPEVPAVGVRAAARAWLREHWTPGTQPADLTAALRADGIEITRQESSRNVGWAREHLREREGVSA